MIDRETLLRCLDLAVRLNDDGDVDHATRDAGRLAEWLDAQVKLHRDRGIRKLETSI